MSVPLVVLGSGRVDQHTVATLAAVLGVDLSRNCSACCSGRLGSHSQAALDILLAVHVPWNRYTLDTQ